ncbi:hypothetical protein D9758_015531 [Tetrapyrgos nigripes]|uniref:CxC2-like cysteine cluster KDZ transposase-associated domain-containing protein n=1 Tax=Tetrapyrgos nigripes TaxID=182062 RepID=A0A8H5FTQ8_9AGAR|nr:hypothetical protein D9758_015531 [Tetrapyrgos nigripes]
MPPRKRKRDEEDDWYENIVGTSTTLEVSQDDLCLNMQSQQLSQDDYHAYSSELEDGSDYYSEDNLNESAEHNAYADNDSWSAVWDSGVVENDISLQRLSDTQNPDSGNIRVRRARNEDSDNPNRAWIQYHEEFLEEMLWVEGRRGMGQRCSGCRGSEEVCYRCSDQECVGAGMMCQLCVVKAHSNLPLHWIEKWNDKFFDTVSLRSLGLTVQLGHLPGEICLLECPADHDFTVLHTNGIHNVAVLFCRCDVTLEHRVQLLRNLWYPATPKAPQTATTFSYLRQFQHLNCTGKMPPYDYYWALEIMTLSRLRAKPKDRYRVFLRAIFQWRHLKMLKQAGRGHSPGKAAGTSSGELALSCPACPQHGKNIPEDLSIIAPELFFLYTQFLAVDANFRLRNKIVSNQYRSPILGDGWAYMVPSGPYKEHLAKHTTEEDMSSCSGFAALFLANVKNVKGLRVSGVGGVCCGRHRVWRGNGLGDLQNGERYSNMDFIFWSAIKEELYLCIVISYDISCQWSRNFWSRMEGLDPSIRVKYTTRGIIFMVPKFHLRAHQPACHIPFSFNFAPGSGQTHGEVVEEGWAQTNKVAAQTKEMGPGTRAMALDDIFGFCNWQTIENLADKVLGKRLIEAVKEFDEHYEDFRRFDSGLEKALTREVLDGWKQMVLDWEEDHSRFCPYEVSGTESNESLFKKMQLKLAQEEHQRLVASQWPHSSSLVVFITQGIELQESQRALELFILTNKFPTPTQQLDLHKRRSSLFKRIVHFRSLQALLMPRLSDVLSPDHMKHIETPDSDRPEKIRLFLPSEVGTASARTHACVSELSETEITLRESEACQALEGVRQGLRARTATTRYKIRNVTGQVGSTRASGVLRQVDIRIHSQKIQYQLARDALIRLGGRGTWEKELLELKDSDVVGLNERKLTEEEAAQREERRKRIGVDLDDEDEDVYLEDEQILAQIQGESCRVLSWIWNGVTVNKGDDEFRDVVRVEWCKTRARMLRWKEEVLLLTEEIKRMHDFALWKGEWWLKRRVGEGEGLCSVNLSAELAEGLDAYAWQQTQFQVDGALKVQARWNELAEHAKKVVARIRNLPTISLELDVDEMISAAQAEQDM